MKRAVGTTLFGMAYLLVGVLFLAATPLFSILFILAAVGIFLRKPFGRYAALAASAAGIALNSIRVFNKLQLMQQSDFLIAVLLTYLFHVGALYYFTRPNVKEQFK